MFYWDSIPTCGLPLHFFDSDIWGQVFHFDVPNLLGIFSFLGHIFGIMSKLFFPNPRSKNIFLQWFSSSSFIIRVYVQGFEVWDMSWGSFLHLYSELFQHHLWKTFVANHRFTLYLRPKWLDHIVCVYSWSLYCAPMI